MTVDRKKSSGSPAHADDAAVRTLVKFHEAASGKVQIQLYLSNDRLNLYIRASRLGAGATAQVADRVEPINAEDLLSLFPSTVPRASISMPQLQWVGESLESASSSPVRRIAHGTAAAPGKDGKIVWLVRAHRTGSGQKLAGKDLWIPPNDVQLIESFEIGRVIARIYPPGPGTDGTDVLGERIPSSDGAAIAPLLEGPLRIESVNGKDWEQVVAEQSGFVRITGERIYLEPELRIAGDVDNKCGSVEFAGAVRVRGNVIAGFYVQAHGDITIEGDLSGGAVISSEGSVEIVGAVVGSHSDTQTVGEHIGLRALELSANRPKQEISAAGSVRISTTSNSRIVAGSDIFIKNESLHSKLRTRGMLHLPHGHLIGGESFVTKGFDIDVMGSPKAASTTVSVSSDVDSTSEGNAIAANLKSHETALETLRLYLGPYADSEEKLAKLDDHHRQRMIELRGKMQSVLTSRNMLLIEQEKLQARSVPLDDVPLVIRSCFHPGAVVVAGDKRFTVEMALQGPFGLRYESRTGAFSLDKNPPISS